MSTANPSSSLLRWGIMGTGSIAHAFAQGLQHSTTGKLMAVGSRTAEAAARFGDEFSAPRRHASYEALLADPFVDAVYIALPNHLHLEWVVRAAAAGKHILCEKPITTNHAEAMIAFEAARYHGVFMMEAFMYRCHPQTARLVELIRTGAVGDVRMIEAHFSFNVGEADYDQFRHQSASAGGGIMDVGCYCTTMARLLAGAALGRETAEPLEVKGVAGIDPIGRVDEWATAVCKFPGDILANLTCGMRMNDDSTVTVWGSKGHLHVASPWFCGERCELLLYRDGTPTPERITVEAGAPLYTLEADTVARCVAAGQQQAPAPCMTWADSLANMRTLDRWRRDSGLTFDNEQPAALTVPLTIRPTPRKPQPLMRYGRVPGIDRPISRLVMGTMVLWQAELPFACALLDHYVELGGNCFDTAFVYDTEGILGRWMRLRNNRREMHVIAKGAHTPCCDPDSLTRELMISLDRLGSDYVDLYLMHRDNPEIPAGEFVEVLNEHWRAGRIRAFGGSNWAPERIVEANRYAREHGLQGFSISSPNLALAVWNEPMWDGCVAAADRASRAWYRQTQMPLFAWSSQASGFFTGRYRPEDRDNPAYADVVRTWFNEGNWQRLARAQELAARKGVTATQIALAYVLCQPLNIFALIGPATVDETQSSAQALAVELTPEELRWLNLEE